MNDGRDRKLVRVLAVSMDTIKCGLCEFNHAHKWLLRGPRNFQQNITFRGMMAEIPNSFVFRVNRHEIYMLCSNDRRGHFRMNS